MHIKQLKYFVCLAEELHFGRAAEKLHIAQPALSIQIRNLEEFLGGALFKRNKRKVILTNAGIELLPKAVSLLTEMDQFIVHAGKIFDQHIQCLNITYSGLSAYTSIMGNVITEFKKLFPKVTLNLVENDPHHQLKSLIEGNTHVAFMTTIGREIPDVLEKNYITSYPLRVILPSNHVLAADELINPVDLKNEPFVVYASPGDIRPNIVIQTVLGFTPVISHKVSSPLLLPSMVNDGLGIALIPSAFDNISQNAGTIIRSLPNTFPNMDISLLYAKNNDAFVLNRFIELVLTFSNKQNKKS